MKNQIRVILNSGMSAFSKFAEEQGRSGAQMMPDHTEPFQLQMVCSPAAAKVTEPFRAMNQCKTAAPLEHTVCCLKQLIHTAGILAGRLTVRSPNCAASGRKVGRVGDSICKRSVWERVKIPKIRLYRKEAVRKLIPGDVSFCAVKRIRITVHAGDLQIPAAAQKQQTDYAAAAAQIADTAARLRRSKGAKKHGIRTQGKCAFRGERVGADLFKIRRDHRHSE